MLFLNYLQKMHNYSILDSASYGHSAEGRTIYFVTFETACG